MFNFKQIRMLIARQTEFILCFRIVNLQNIIQNKTTIILLRIIVILKQNSSKAFIKIFSKMCKKPYTLKTLQPYIKEDRFKPEKIKMITLK